MSNLKGYVKLQSDLEDLERKAAQTEGGLKEIKDTLKKEFGTSTIKEAKAIRKQLRREREKLESEYETVLKKFNQDYPNLGDE